MLIKKNALLHEEQIEAYIYNTYTAYGKKPQGEIKGRNKLKKNGLSIKGHLFRQVNLGSYGRADLIEIWENERLPNNILITIYELKSGKIDYPTLDQSLLYAVSIQHLLKEHFGNKTKVSIHFKFCLIGTSYTTLIFANGRIPYLYIYLYEVIDNEVYFHTPYFKAIENNVPSSSSQCMKHQIKLHKTIS